MTWYVAPNGTGTGTSAADPLGTLNAAWLKVTGGDTIYLAGGTYAGETLGRRTSSKDWTTNVTIKPMEGQVATLTGTTQIEASVGHITFDGLDINGRLSLRSVYGNFVVQNSTFRGDPNAFLVAAALRLSSSNVVVRNNTFSNYYGADAITVSALPGVGAIRSNHVTIDHNVIQNFYDNELDPADAIHEDGIQFYDTEDLTITNNVINRVSNSTIIDSPGAGSGIARVRIENNFLRKMDGNGSDGYGVLNLLYTKVEDIEVVNNTVMSDIHAANTAEILLRNNIIDRYQVMGALVVKDHNLLASKASGITLDPTEILSPLPLFVDPLTGDLHIADANTVDLARGTWLSAPAIDYDGETRYGSIWLGADQLPEPSTGALCVMVAAGLLRRRRRSSFTPPPVPPRGGGWPAGRMSRPPSAA